jgi:uncharacterized protein involved in outer membrane biogenesis
MRALFKVLGIALVLALIVVVGLVVYVTTIDPGTLIALVQAKVKDATGRDLTVRGGARIVLSLHPRIVLTDVALSNAPWASTKDMLKAQRVELALALMPLLSRRFELEEIRLFSPQLALETSAKGEKNWQTQPASPTPQAPAGGGGANLAAAVAVSDFRIDNGLVTYRDDASAAVTGVTIDKFSLHERALGSDLQIEFKGKVGDTAIALSGQIGPFESLMAQRWPYPVDVGGEIEGQKFAVATKVKAQAQKYMLDELRLTLGANSVKGAFALDTSAARTKLVFDIEAPTLALSAVPVPAVPPAPAPAKANGNHLIPDAPVSFAPLRWTDADGKLAIGKVVLASGREYQNVRLQFTLRDGRLEMRDFSLGAFGGSLAGSLVVDASRAEAASLDVNVDGKGLSLGALLAALGHPREVKGGKSDFAANLTMRGASPHAWMASATGNVRFVSGPATIVNAKLAGAVAAWDRLSDAVNPFRAHDPSTELVCAVVRLPIANGVARVDRSIAMETSKLGVTASGTLDFRNETLDLTFAPKAKKGISIDFAGFSELVRVSGPFASPQVGIDPAGSAKVIASLGAAISTGGLSAVAQGLLSWSEGSGPGPCQIALGAAPAQPPAPKGKGREAPIPNELGKALGKLFGR